MHMQLLDAKCRVESAKAVLGAWLETLGRQSQEEANMVGAIMFLLDGVPEAIDAAENEQITTTRKN